MMLLGWSEWDVGVAQEKKKDKEKDKKDYKIKRKLYR